MKKYNNFLLDSFLLEKEVGEGLSVRSLEAYISIFALLLDNDYIRLDDFKTYTVANFKVLLAETFLARSWGSSTYNSYRKYFRVFCEYLKREKYIDINPLDEVKKRKCHQALPKTLSKEQVNELLLSLPNAFDTKGFVGYRNETMVICFLFTGLRKSELLNLKINDLDIEDGFLRVNAGKGNKDRLVPLPTFLLKRLISYIKKRQIITIGSNSLFCSRSGLGLRDRDMKLIIEKIRYCLTFHFTWHQLRHTYATELVRNNFDIFNISKILGHTKVSTTQIYLSSNVEKMKEQIDLIKMFS